MKRLLVSTVLLLLSVGVYANGDGPRGFCNGPGNDCNKVTISNKAYGGDAYAKGGDAYQKQTAYGGNAYSDQEQGQFQIGINKQDQDQYQGQGQDQDQYQKALSIALQKQSTDGNKQNLTINSNTKVEAEPAIAPAIAPGDPTAPCIATYGGSGAGGGVFSFGISAYEYDEICGGLEFYRATADSDSKEVQAMRAVTIRATYALLQQKIESELGPDGYASAVGITVEDSGTQAVRLRRSPQGDLIQASYGRN